MKASYSENLNAAEMAERAKYLRTSYCAYENRNGRKLAMYIDYEGPTRAKAARLAKLRKYRERGHFGI